MTKKENYEAIRRFIVVNGGDNEWIEFIDHEMEMLDKRSGSRGMTKTQKENVEIKDAIVNALANFDAPVTVTEFTDACNMSYSPQRITALLYQLIDEGRVVKTVDKRKSYFSVARQ